MKNIYFALITLFFTNTLLASNSAPVLHSQMQIQLIPALSNIQVVIQIELPKNSSRSISFQLHKNLNIESRDPENTVTLVRTATGNEISSEWRLDRTGQDQTISLHYSGTINDPIEDDGDSSGLITNEGTVLFGSSYWYPVFSDTDLTYEIEIVTPENYKILTQGDLISEEIKNHQLITHYSEKLPQDEVYLVAGAYQTFTLKKNNINYSVWLHENDTTLAEKYLKLLPQYTEHFSELIGPYAYASFSTIENLWETGYGMPSFTLLGPQVMRLPFILTSSLPHEILHNWWGNSVYVNYQTGNWCEGLTTYMADHWQQELTHQDVSYRQNTLINYQDYVKDGNEFPLKDFKGRHSESSQAIGYGKSMMLFHMLKVRLGENIFNQAMRNFYKNNIFKVAGFQDLKTSFEAVSGENLSRYFNQWVSQKGAPQIKLEQASSSSDNDSYVTTFTLKQSEVAYELTVPVRFTYSDRTTEKINFSIDSIEKVFSYKSTQKITKIEIDPDFDVFRQIYTEERPLTLSHLFGTEQVKIFAVNTSEASAFIDTFKAKFQGQSDVLSLTDDLQLPSDADVLFVGDSPQIRNIFKNQLPQEKFSITDSELMINNQNYDVNASSWVLIARSLKNPDQALIWVRWSSDMNSAEWAQRLTHYGKYGLLIFQGRPVVLKDNWPITRSPLKKEL